MAKPRPKVQCGIKTIGADGRHTLRRNTPHFTRLRTDKHLRILPIHSETHIRCIAMQTHSSVTIIPRQAYDELCSSRSLLLIVIRSCFGHQNDSYRQRTRTPPPPKRLVPAPPRQRLFDFCCRVDVRRTHGARTEDVVIGEIRRRERHNGGCVGGELCGVDRF